jgi:hypothetical protein
MKKINGFDLPLQRMPETGSNPCDKRNYEDKLMNEWVFLKIEGWPVIHIREHLTYAKDMI